MSGTFSRRLTLEAAETVDDAGGGATRSWRALGRCWAELRAVSGRERMRDGGAVSRATLRCRIPWTPPGGANRPTAGMRFREGERVFEIVAIGDDDPWRRHLLCWLAEEQDG
jgi:SPP1 family predicted phage head-tail adaptor